MARAAWMDAVPSGVGYMKSHVFNPKHNQSGLRVARAIFAGLVALVAANHLANAARLRNEQSVVSRPVGEPIMAIISLRDQQITVYDDKGWIMRAPVSSGQRGRETPAGIFSVLQKDAKHYSNMYDDAYMPHMQRITWSGIALHGGVLLGYPASHGCVRMPYDFAERLFGTTKLGMRVIVAPGNAAPVAIDPPALFQSKTGAATAAASAAAATEKEAASKANQVRLVAMTAYREWMLAMVPVRKAETLKLKADWELAEAERAIAAAASPEAKQLAEDAKAKAAARIGVLEAQLAGQSRVATEARCDDSRPRCGLTGGTRARNRSRGGRQRGARPRAGIRFYQPQSSAPLRPSSLTARTRGTGYLSGCRPADRHAYFHCDGTHEHRYSMECRFARRRTSPKSGRRSERRREKRR